MNNVKYLLDEVLACFLVKKKKKGNFHITYMSVLPLNYKIQSHPFSQNVLLRLKSMFWVVLWGCLFKNHCLLQFD